MPQDSPARPVTLDDVARTRRLPVPPMSATRARRILLRSVGRDLRRGLARVAIAGEPPRTGAVLAPSHVSWWDGYLLTGMAGLVGRTGSVMMARPQLDAFPYLRLVGARPPSAVPALARDAATGRWVVVFPEGEIRAPGAPFPTLHDGAAWVARRASVPLVPVALRVLQRGRRTPEAFLRFAASLDAASPNLRGTTAQLAHALRLAEERLDADVAGTPPDDVPRGYRVVLHGHDGAPRETSPASRLLAAMTRGVE